MSFYPKNLLKGGLIVATLLLSSTAFAGPRSLKSAKMLKHKARGGSDYILWNAKPRDIDEKSYYWRMFQDMEEAERFFYWLKRSPKFDMERKPHCKAKEPYYVICRGRFLITSRSLLKYEEWESTELNFKLTIPHPNAFEEIDFGLLERYDQIWTREVNASPLFEQIDTVVDIKGIETRLVKWRKAYTPHHRCLGIQKLPKKIRLEVYHEKCDSLLPIKELFKGFEYDRLEEKLNE